jgi:hypothetical protein
MYGGPAHPPTTHRYARVRSLNSAHHSPVPSLTRCCSGLTSFAAEPESLGCATEGAENQRMKVPPEKLSVHLGSYPGGRRGNPVGRSPGDRRPTSGGSSNRTGRNVSESRAGLERAVVDADRSLTAGRPMYCGQGPKHAPAVVHRGSGNGTYERFTASTWETRSGAGSRPRRHLGWRPSRESERPTVPLKPGNSGGGRGSHFWVLPTERRVRGLA